MHTSTPRDEPVMKTPVVFDYPDADIILLSGGIEGPNEFKVHRNILSVASPFFRDMFSLPQDPALGKVQTLPMPESRQTLEALLCFVYPLPDPDLTTLEEVKDMLAVTTKYEFDSVTNALRHILLSPTFLHTSPVRVYAIACRFELDEEAKIASRYTLNVNLLDVSLDGASDGAPEGVGEDLKWITAFHYHQLMVLHKRRAAEAIRALHEVAAKDEIKCVQCNGSSFHHSLLHSSMSGSGTTSNYHSAGYNPSSSLLSPHSMYGHGHHPALLPKWWIEFESRAKEELGMRPTTDKIFSLEFLFGCAGRTGCARCPGSVLESWKSLMELKRGIDELPSTI
jgi:BTB/POZ domain